MSVGAVDEDEDEKEPVYEGPEPETFVDRVNAQPLPANASNGQMGDEQWPPAVPSEAPGMVPPAAQSGPAQPQAPATAPPVNVPQQLAQAFADQQTLGDADVAAQQALGAAKAKAGTAEADQLDTEADRRQEAADTQAQIIQTANQRTQQWADRAAQENEKYMKMDLHDYWADKSTGSRVLGGLAMILGAVGRTDNSGNAGMQIINQAIERDFRMQQANLEKRKTMAGFAREDAKNAQEYGSQMLRLKEAAATDAAAAKLVALKVRQGIPVEQAQNDADVIALRQKANQQRMGTLKEVHGMNLEDAKLEIEKQKEADDRLKAQAYARKLAAKGAGGGAGSGKAYDAFHAAVLAGAPNVGELAAQAGIKPAQISEQIEKIRTEERKENPANAGEDNPLAVRDGNGNVQGLAPNARSVKAIQDRWVQYDNAIDALKQLQADRANSSLPSPGIGDPLYDKAVLAVSAVTQANASDKTTGHEAGTLKKYGLVNQGSIANVLADMQRRQEQFGKQLRPLPEPKTPAAGGQTAAPSAPAQRAASATQQARAKAIVSDPSKRSLYSEKDWAKLIKASRGN